MRQNSRYAIGDLRTRAFGYKTESLSTEPNEYGKNPKISFSKV